MTTLIPIPQVIALMIITLLVVWAWFPRSLIPSLLILFLTIFMGMFLGGCANAPATPAPVPSSKPPVASTTDPLEGAVGRIGNRTAGTATKVYSRAAQGSIYQATGGNTLGKIGAAAVLNTATEIQRWWYGQ